MMTVVDDAMLYNWNVLRVEIECFHPRKMNI